MIKLRVHNTGINISELFFSYISLLLIFDKTGIVIPVIISALVHELGHIIAALKYGCKIKNISLMPGGFLIKKTRCNNKSCEIFVLLCGPLFNIIFATVFLLLNSIIPYDGLLISSAINYILGIVNLFPIYGLDGGNIILEHISKERTNNLFLKLSAVLSIMFFILLLFYTVKVKNINAVFIVFYLICVNILKI